jgi:hypothetical protein
MKKRNASIAPPLLAGLLALVLVAPCALADDEPHKSKPEMSSEARPIDVDPIAEGWFGPEQKWEDEPYDAQAQIDVYAKKYLNEAVKPIGFGIRMYDRGAYTPRPTWLGEKNPINFGFLAYGDVRVAAASYDNGGGDSTVLATRLNLDLDMAITATERIHAFVRPLDNGTSFTRYQFSGPDEGEFIDELDFDLNTLFFEGDIGAITQGLTNRTNQLDLPVTFGRVPLFTQNGIWLDDAIDGGAIGITAKNSPRFDVSNTDLTFFVGIDNVNTAAVPTATDSKLFGIAGFADARQGYFEYGYGYVNADNGDLSYHNLTAAFTRRYKGRLANSIRLIGNLGQKGIAGSKTADGVLLLLENSLIPRYTPHPEKFSVLTFVPYFNLFAGFDSPQPLARAADSGGVLKNTGINFESDGLTAYPTLNATARESYGGAAGIEYLFDLTRQIVVEGAVVQTMDDVAGTSGNEYAVGVRYQHKIKNAWIVRADAMHGWRQGLDDVYGVRLEIRRKF